jgi:hypothetical protein
MNAEPDLQCLIARTPEDLARVYRLRYACYRHDESIPANPEEQFRDAFDSMPNTFSFLLRPPQDEPIATMRISVVQPERRWHEAPVQHVFGDHAAVDSMAREGFVEASRLCFAQPPRRDLFVKLVGYMAAMASFYDVRWLVACPRIEHADTFQRVFGFKSIAPPRQYFGVRFRTELLAISRKEIVKYVRDEKTMTTAWSSALEHLTRAATLRVSQAGWC